MVSFTVTNCGIWVRVDFQFANPEWMCSVGVMIQVSQDSTPIPTDRHKENHVCECICCCRCWPADCDTEGTEQARLIPSASQSKEVLLCRLPGCYVLRPLRQFFYALANFEVKDTSVKKGICIISVCLFMQSPPTGNFFLAATNSALLTPVDFRSTPLKG